MKKNINRLFKVLGPGRWSYIAAGILLIVGVFFKTLAPKVIQVTVDQITMTTGENLDQPVQEDAISGMFTGLMESVGVATIGEILLFLGLAYLLVALIRGGFMLLASALSASSTEHAIKRLRDRLFGHIQRLPLSYHNRMSTGELIQRSTGDLDTVRRFILNQVVEIIRLSAIFIFAFAMLLGIYWPYALVSVALLPVVMFGGYWFFGKENKVWEEHEKESDKLNAITQENLNGIRTVKAYANEAYEMQKFDAQNKAKLLMGIKHVGLHTLYWPVSDMLVWLQIIIATLIGGYFTLTGKITLGELIGSQMYLNMVMFPMRQLARVLSEMGMATVAMGRIYEILDAPEEDYSGQPVKGETLKGHVVFENVWFRYAEDKKWVLQDVSFEIKPGEKLALIGPSGAGKSTIIKLLSRFYEPDKGRILLDGQPISEIEKGLLREKIGLALQRAFLFSSTVGDNIAYANTRASRDAIIEAARIADFGEVESRFPSGLDTMVGEKGVTLSGGQKQRVSLARTILSEPEIIVLDDVTSAVDTETEQTIFDEMEKVMNRKTTIIISHRVTSIEPADRIIVLDHGKVVQSGTHDQLKVQTGYYRQILALQTALEADIIEKAS